MSSMFVLDNFSHNTIPTMSFLLPKNKGPFMSVIVFLCMIALITFSTSSPHTNETDHQALLAIRALIPGDPLNVFSSWNRSAYFCTWRGVTCSLRHHRVTELDLSSLSLAGYLSPQIGNLTFLRTIHLGNNSFQGQIPQEIGRLFRLRRLLLQNNSFHGEFPSNLTHCQKLRTIHFHNNHLRGMIPAGIGSMSSLLYLILAGNHFSGPIPSSYGNISSLRTLALMDNNLEGTIPFEIGFLSKLENLQLSNCNLSGMVPRSIFNHSRITQFSLAHNSFQGSLPPICLPKLKYFYLGNNSFYGHLPSSVTNASELVKIDIGQNSFSGALPTNMGSLQNLQLLSIYSNSFGAYEGNDLMNFIHSLSNCSNLWLLNLAFNGFRGSLSNSIANFSTTKLVRLYLDGNRITGNIPFGVGSLVNLILLGLSENMLTGEIPESIGKLSKLQMLFLYANRISSKIPSSIGNMSRLNTLAIQDNLLAGNIPDSLGNCTTLETIDLENNLLDGSIPEQIFAPPFLSMLFLNSNNFTGEVPFLVGNLKNLWMLNISENMLTGEIPSTLGSCEVLEFLYMQGNYFNGTIPESFKQLKGITVLDLSQNNLSGHIPGFLADLAWVQNLNLSYNMFSGEVPNKGVFKNISAFSILGNDKLCGGIEALNLQPCPTKANDKARKHLNGRVVIPAATSSATVVLLICLALVFCCIKRSRRNLSSKSIPQRKYPKLSYAELLKATGGFSSANLLGEGRYGTVYRGLINSNEQIVAVKVLNLQRHGASKTFLAECEVLRTIRHRNLVKIITSCSSIDFKGCDFKALVFEFMPNGSLESWLHPTNEEQESKSLGLLQRLNIAIDVASALDYLHNYCNTTILHCDLKPSNILLDSDFCAHVSDFGLARIISVASGIPTHRHSSSVAIKGTVGYVAPEYGMGCELSSKGDMYSYGVMILEMFTGKRPTSNIFYDSLSIHNYVKDSLPAKVMEITDTWISSEDEDERNRTLQSGRLSNVSKVKDALVSVLQIGVACSVEFPNERMCASDVLTQLHEIRNAFLTAF